MTLFRLLLILSSTSILSACNASGEDGALQEIFLESDSVDQYDFKSEKSIKTLGTYVLIASPNEIKFHKKHGELFAALAYKNELTDFNFNGIYKLENTEGDIFYFRFGWVNIFNEETRFQHLQWLKDTPAPSKLFKDYIISSVQIDFKQEGKVSVCTIGDSQTWWKYAGALRADMNKVAPELTFVGSNTDIYGYGHEAEGGNSIQQVIDRFEYIPKADYFTILLGANDWNQPVDKSTRLMDSLIKKVHLKYPESKIVFLTPIPTTQSHIEEPNQLLAERLIPHLEKLDYIIIADLGAKMKSQENWQTTLMDGDGLHQSITGVEFMAKTIVSVILNDQE